MYKKHVNSVITDRCGEFHANYTLSFQESNNIQDFPLQISKLMSFAVKPEMPNSRTNCVLCFSV